LFTDPNYGQVYETSLKVVQNMDLIQKQTQSAVNELNNGKCARAGYVMGKLIRQILLTDASVSQALGISVQKAGEMVKA